MSIFLYFHDSFHLRYSYSIVTKSTNHLNIILTLLNSPQIR